MQIVGVILLGFVIAMINAVVIFLIGYLLIRLLLLIPYKIVDKIEFLFGFTFGFVYFGLALWFYIDENKFIFNLLVGLALIANLLAIVYW